MHHRPALDVAALKLSTHGFSAFWGEGVGALYVRCYVLSMIYQERQPDLGCSAIHGSCSGSAGPALLVRIL